MVYVACIHTGHKDTTLQMIRGGKHVLVEKPFAMNVAEAVKMVEAAGKKVHYTHRRPASVGHDVLIVLHASSV